MLSQRGKLRQRLRMARVFFLYIKDALISDVDDSNGREKTYKNVHKRTVGETPRNIKYHYLIKKYVYDVKPIFVFHLKTTTSKLT